jgi:hypothetical protein
MDMKWASILRVLALVKVEALEDVEQYMGCKMDPVVVWGLRVTGGIPIPHTCTHYNYFYIMK